MRRAHEIVPSTEREAFVRSFDVRDIDSPDLRNFWRLKYMERLDTVTALIRRHLPDGGTVIEIGSAQANISLTLAEQGYSCVAYDIDADFLSYSRKKHTHGRMEWVQGNAFDLVAPNAFDAAVLAEVIEHVAHPDDLIRAALSLVRPGGVVIITTPNGRRLGCRVPSFAKAMSDMADAERRQFGAAGENHLFEPRPAEFAALMPSSAEKLEHSGFGSVLYCRALQPLLRGGPLGKFTEQSLRWLSRDRRLRWFFADSQVCVLRRHNVEAIALDSLVRQGPAGSG